MLKNFYEYEREKGSIIKGVLSQNKGFYNLKNSDLKKLFLTSELRLGNKINAEKDFKDLVDLRQHFKNQSVWRIRTGMSELVDKIVDKLSQEKNVKFFLNEPVDSVDFSQDESQQIQIKTKSSTQNVDLVISSVHSGCNLNYFLKNKNFL